MNAKYQYSEESTIHQPLEVQANGIHTWTLVLNGEEYRVTREVWEAFHADNQQAAADLARLQAERDALETELHFFRSAFPHAASNYQATALRGVEQRAEEKYCTCYAYPSVVSADCPIHSDELFEPRSPASRAATNQPGGRAEE